MQMDKMHHYPAAANGICHDPIETHSFLRWSPNNTTSVMKSLCDLNVFNIGLTVEQQMIADQVFINIRPLDISTEDKVEVRSFLLTAEVQMPLKEVLFDLRVKYKAKNGTWSDKVFKKEKISFGNGFQKTLDLVNPLRTEALESLAYHIIVIFSDVHYEVKQDRAPVTGMTAMRSTTEIFSNPLPTRSLPDFTREGHHPMATLELKMADGSLHAFAQVLGSQSTVFAQKISRPDQVIQIENRSLKEMLLFLRLVHPATPERIFASNANQVICMAGEYQVYHLMESAERVQCAALHENLVNCAMALKSFALAKQYQLGRLEAAAVKCLGKAPMEQVQSEENFRQMDKETQCALAMAKMQIYESTSSTNYY